MAAIRVKCPGCESVLSVPETARGKKVRCRTCSHMFRVAEKKGAPSRQRRRQRPVPQDDDIEDYDDDIEDYDDFDDYDDDYDAPRRAPRRKSRSGSRSRGGSQEYEMPKAVVPALIVGVVLLIIAAFGGRFFMVSLMFMAMGVFIFFRGDHAKKTKQITNSLKSRLVTGVEEVTGDSAVTAGWFMQVMGVIIAVIAGIFYFGGLAIWLTQGRW